MNFKYKLRLMGLVAIMALMTSPVKALAAPHYTLSPASGEESIGQDFQVTLGIDSNAEKVVGIDIKATFDSDKLEIVSIDKANVPDSGYQFTLSPSQANIHNDTGGFDVSLPASDSNIYSSGVVAVHDLLKITFRPKATGVATMSFVCTAASTTETNIIALSSNDVVDCASNQSGSYTISGGNSGSADTSTSNTPTPTSTSSQQLPKTGAVENTMVLIVIGLGSMLTAAYLRKI